MNWFEKAIRKEVEKAVPAIIYQWMDKSLDGVVRDILGLNLSDDAPMMRTQFVFAIARHLYGTDPAIGPDVAKRRANQALDDYLKDEKINFGHPDYGWDRNSAITIAQEYETDHWERRP